MSVKHALLALLSSGPQHGYALKVALEQTTGQLWTLNVGQVYTTLARLERDELVEGEGEDGEGRVAYSLTEAGEAELARWFDSPLRMEERPRDDLALKVAMAAAVPGVDLAGVIRSQRTAALGQMRDLTRLRAEDDTAWMLMLEAMRLRVDAELRWLDFCEDHLKAASAQAAATAGPRVRARARR